MWIFSNCGFGVSISEGIIDCAFNVALFRDDRWNKLMSAAPRASGSWPVEVIESGRIIGCGE